jgi:hypothetical protein
MASKVRVTARTDTRGTVNAEYRGLYEVEALAKARKAGIPSDLLDAAGWTGDPNDLRGLWAELVYRLGEVNWTAPDAVDQLAEIVDSMQTLCRSLGVDPRAAIPYGMAKLKRQLHEGRERHAARLRGAVGELPRAEASEVSWGVW